MKEPEWITEETYHRILNYPLLCAQDLCILNLLWDTGIRRGELCQLNIDDVNLTDDVLHIRKEISKGEYSFRYCPFTKETSENLKKHIHALNQTGRESGALFLAPCGDRISDNKVNEKLAAIGKFFGCHLTPHMFRHGWGARMLEKGADQLFVMSNLGHSSASMTNRYIHLRPKSARKIYDRIQSCA